jgi:hypothetical protein
MDLIEGSQFTIIIVQIPYANSKCFDSSFMVSRFQKKLNYV